MTSELTKSFRDCFRLLPERVRQTARKIIAYGEKTLITQALSLSR
jgi:hypothetical protein